MQERDDAWYEQVFKERDDLLHSMEVLERQIDELCARDDFEKAEQLDVELQTLQHRLDVVEAMLPLEEEESADEAPSLLLHDATVARNSGRQPVARGNRSSVRLGPGRRDSRRDSQRGSGAWQDIPLTPTPPVHKPRPPPQKPLPPDQRPAPPPALEVACVVEALSTPHILDVIFSFLTAEELGRICAVNRLWQERVEQDELWQRVFRAEWQQEVNPSPGTYKRWYGAMRSARLSWRSPILQQECIHHETFSGRVEIKTVGVETYLVAMSMEACTVWKYSSLQVLHEIRHSCAYALGTGSDADEAVRLIGGDKKGSQWIVWDVLTGAKLFACPADEGSFSGGWYIVFRNYLAVYRRSQQVLRGYRWNYDCANPEDISPPMLAWEVTGNFAMPKATRFGLLVTDFFRGLVRVDFNDGAMTVLLKERSEDLDPRNPRVRFLVDRPGSLVTRRAFYKNAPVLIYSHYQQGVILQRSVAVMPKARFCCLSEDMKLCFGIEEAEDGKPMAGLLWNSSEDCPTARRLEINLSHSTARYLDSAVCNNVVAGLFGDMRPSELILWDAITGKELSKLKAEQGQRPYQLLRFTGLTACMVHRDGALTKVRVVGRRKAQEEGSSCAIQ